MKFKSEVQLEALNNAAVDTDKFLVSDSSTIKYRTGAEVLSDIGGQPALTNPITGSGTTNYVPKFTGASSIGNSELITDGSGNLAVAQGNAPTQALNIYRVGSTQTVMAAGNSNTGLNGTYFGVDANGNGIINTTGGFANIFSTNGSERMRITNAGNVGIGTSVPATRFDVQLATNKHILFHNGNGEAEILSTTDNGSAYVPLFISASPLVLNVNNGSNVGIGTTSPNSKLSISYSSAVVDALNIVNTNTNGRSWYVGDGAGVVAGTFGFYDAIAALSRLVINASGNVGIGATSPVSIGTGITTLDIQGSAAGGIAFGLSGTKNYIYGASTMYVEANTTAVFATNGSEKMRITSAGNVGIGTTSPNTLLTLSKTISSNTRFLEINNAGNNQFSSTIDFTVASGVTVSQIASIYPGSNNVGLSFSTYGTSPSTGLHERMRINGSNGNVGIGTTSPTSKLEVFDGDISVTTSGSFSFFNSNRNFIPNTGGVSLGALRFRGYSTGTTYQVGSAIYSFSQGTWSSTSAPGYLSLQTTSAGSTSPSERMVINSAGGIKFNNYGSGTFTGTATQKLAVDSSGNIIEIPIGAGPVDGSGTTNYVTKWTDSDTIGNSIMYDNGTNVGIGTASPTAKLSIGGVGSALSFDTLGASGTTEIKTIQDYELSIKNNRGTSTEILVGNEILKFSTSELERMRITNTGNVGIGTSSPSYKLDVNGSINVSSGSTIRWGSGDADIYNSGYDLVFRTWTGSALTEKLRITSAGNVGIGTIAPGAKLEVNGNIKYNGDIFPTTAGRASILNETPTSTNPNIVPSNSSLATGLGGDNGNLALIINSNPAVYVNSSSNVGIGTTSPTAKLDVNGSIIATVVTAPNINVTANNGMYNAGTNIIGFQTNSSPRMVINALGDVGIGTVSPQVDLDVASKDAAGTVARIRLTNKDLSVVDEQDLSEIQFYNSDADGAHVSAYIKNIAAETFGRKGQLAFGVSTTNSTNAVEALRIDENANVGIGTTSPTDKLTVNGTFRSTALWTTSGGITQWGNLTTAYGGLTWDTGYATIYGASGNDLRFGANGSDVKMILKTSGNFGIGTTTPRTPLEVKGNGLILSYSTANAAARDYLVATNYTAYGDFTINQANANAGDPYTAGTSRFYINPTGNVGIGTTSPTQKLDVSGSIKASGSVQVGDDSTVASATNVGATRYRSDANNSYMDMVMQTGASTYAWVNVVQNNW